MNVTRRRGVPTRALFAAVVLAGAVTVGGCASTPRADSPSTSASQAVAPSTSAASPSSCAQLFAHLQDVTAALGASSQLLATSQNPQQLASRIDAERARLEQAAQLMSSGTVPDALRDADRRMVAALRVLAADFAKAKDPALRGDFQAAAAAMTDQATVQQVLDASSAIEKACR